MKDPSALSSINVNKYFPQPRSIRIKGKGKTHTHTQRKAEEGRKKKSIGRELCLKGGGVVMVVGEEGVEALKIGLPSWVNNETCFLCFKGRNSEVMIHVWFPMCK